MEMRDGSAEASIVERGIGSAAGVEVAAGGRSRRTQCTRRRERQRHRHRERESFLASK